MSEMSNERQETIADITKEMRHVCHNPTLGVKTNREKSLEKFLKDMLLEYVCRIEEAHKREREAGVEEAQICGEIGEMIGREAACKESLQVGNAAAMRDALAQAQRVLHCAIVADILKGEDAHEALNAVSTALSAPPRNCDIMDWRTAWAKWRTECHPQKPCGYAEVVSGTEQFMDWYMSEAKGETK